MALRRSLEPVGVGIKEQLKREDGGEEGVQLLQAIAKRVGAAVFVGQRVDDLRLRRIHREVLRAEQRV
jgi:hypothetical protein